MTFKLRVKFVWYAYHMWFLLIFYVGVYSEVANFASMFGQPADYESIYLFGLNIAEEYVKVLPAYYLESPQCSPLRTASSVKMSALAWICQMHVQFPQCHNRNNSANSVFGNPSIGPILPLSLFFPEIIAFHRNVLSGTLDPGIAAEGRLILFWWAKGFRGPQSRGHFHSSLVFIVHLDWTFLSIRYFNCTSILFTDSPFMVSNNILFVFIILATPTWSPFRGGFRGSSVGRGGSVELPFIQISFSFGINLRYCIYPEYSHPLPFTYFSSTSPIIGQNSRYSHGIFR